MLSETEDVLNDDMPDDDTVEPDDRSASASTPASPRQVTET
jgi:hypothetical protein